MAVSGRVAPAIVVVVVECEQFFEGKAARIDAVSITKVALDLFDTGCPFAIHVPARPGDSRDGLGGFLGGQGE